MIVVPPHRVAQTCQIWSNSWGKFGRVLAKFGGSRDRTKLDQVGPVWAGSGPLVDDAQMLFEFGRLRTNFACSRAESGRIWPNSAPTGRTLPKLGRTKVTAVGGSCPKFGTLGTSCPLSPEFDGFRPHVGQIRHALGQVWDRTRPICGKKWPAFREFARPLCRNARRSLCCAWSLQEPKGAKLQPKIAVATGCGLQARKWRIRHGRIGGSALELLPVTHPT